MNCPLETRENAQLLLDYCTPQARTGVQWLSWNAISQSAAPAGNSPGGQRAVWQAMDAWEAAPVSADFDSRLYRRIESAGFLVGSAAAPVPSGDAAARSAGHGDGLPAGGGRSSCWSVPQFRPLPSPPGDVAQVDTVQPEQVEHALDAMEILNEFSHHVRTERPIRNSRR